MSSDGRRLYSGTVLIWRTPKYTGPERRKRPRWRPRPFRVLLVLLGLAAAGYAVAVVWLLTQESRLVIEAGAAPASTRPPFPYDEVVLPRADGAHQFAWIMHAAESGSPAWIVYLHGNATSVGSSVNVAHYRLLLGLGLNVLAPEYRGFGGLEGVTTEPSLRADAQAAYDYLRATRGIDSSRIALYGWSLGSFLAVDLAAAHPVRAVILEAPAASLADLAQRRYPFFPLRMLMRSRFESASRIAGVSAPILFLHGPADEVIPMAAGRELYERAPGEKTFVEIRGGHFDAVQVDEHRLGRALGEFLGRHGLPVEDYRSGLVP